MTNNTLNNIKQFFCQHDWTCNATEGIKPSESALKDLTGFYIYATMYCKKCGKVNDISAKHLEEHIFNDKRRN